ncbi:MAG: polyphosphate kinase 2 [Myxococcales bacterium]|nr:polyphosphate kinase 2 [Myxococcales bacterium]NNK06979.1 polyphosphate kinase 2 [Myxococcales bacterium]NNK44885.1 polyphosphate kinase 2 [Myxococcales bacterium]NNL24224.1 polyphosphate kinase 2 [Myxococcales bacterium]
MSKSEEQVSEVESAMSDEGRGSQVPEKPKLKKAQYNKVMADFQVELVKLQKWIQTEGLKVVVIFEGRDAAGKGGAIKRITQNLNPRVCRVEALAKPTERERTQWYFQRYVEYLPAAGEMVCFDRSWYNRAGVEKVMGYCTEEEYREFLRSCPQFERMLVRSGIILIKYWFSVSDDEQERRFQKRIEDPIRRWKISDVDLQSRKYWVDYSKAKDEMFAHTDIKQAPWYVVQGDNKRRARLNVISHFLSLIPYQEVHQPDLSLPDRQSKQKYVRPPLDDQNFVPEIY